MAVVRGEFFLADYGKHLFEPVHRPIGSDGLGPIHGIHLGLGKGALLPLLLNGWVLLIHRFVH